MAEHQNFDPKKLIRSLTTILLLQKKMRQKHTREELEFLIVNETHRLLSYRQCVLWQKSGRSTQIRTVSGVASFEQDSPYLNWLSGLIETHLPGKEAFMDEEKPIIHVPLTVEGMDEESARLWSEWCDRHALMMAFKLNSEGVDEYHGIWIDRDTPFTEGDINALGELLETYGHALDRLRREHLPFWRQALAIVLGTRGRWVVLALLVLISFYPLKLSVTVPAEIVAQDPFVISAPLEGVIRNVHIEPNRPVSQNDLLISFDDTVLKNQVLISQQELNVIEASYAKTSRQAVRDRRSNAEVAMLEAEYRTKQAELAYAQDLLARSQIYSPVSGVALYSDKNALRGKPVTTGEQILLIADPEAYELQVRIPVDSILDVDPEEPVRVYFNIDPLAEYLAMPGIPDYEATPDADGLVTYKLRADFVTPSKRLKIGLKGTAKVYGPETILFYQVFRRPILAVRQFFGL